MGSSGNRVTRGNQPQGADRTLFLKLRPGLWEMPQAEGEGSGGLLSAAADSLPPVRPRVGGRRRQSTTWEYLGVSRSAQCRSARGSALLTCVRAPSPGQSGRAGSPPSPSGLQQPPFPCPPARPGHLEAGLGAVQAGPRCPEKVLRSGCPQPLEDVTPRQPCSPARGVLVKRGRVRPTCLGDTGTALLRRPVPAHPPGGPVPGPAGPRSWAALCICIWIPTFVLLIQINAHVVRNT